MSIALIFFLKVSELELLKLSKLPSKKNKFTFLLQHNSQNSCHQLNMIFLIFANFTGEEGVQFCLILFLYFTNYTKLNTFFTLTIFISHYVNCLSKYFKVNNSNIHHQNTHILDLFKAR